MKKGEEGIGIVERVEFPTKGYVEADDGKDVVVKGCVEGQKIRYRVKKKRSGRYEGMLLEVLEKSEYQDIEPECGIYDKCGGCTYRDISYKNQIAIKEKMLRGLLAEGMGDEIVSSCFEGIIESPEKEGYRNKMEYSFGDEVKGGELSLGMHKKNSFYDIVTCDDCKIVHEDFNEIVGYTLSFFKERGISYYHKMKHTGVLRHLLIRRTKENEILVGLVTTGEIGGEIPGEIAGEIAGEIQGEIQGEIPVEIPREIAGEEILKAYMEGLLALKNDGKITGEIKGILHIINNGLADTVRSDETRVLYGEEFITEKILGLNFKISTFSFFQTNSKGAEKLYEKAREYVGDTKNKVIYDLYSGTGTIAQVLSPVAKKVVGVEIVEEAVEAAKKNAKLNGINNCEFIAGDVLKELDNIENKPDIIVLDPPRDGVNPKALEKIINYGVDNIVYISCKPTSLARDLKVFKERGYVMKRACGVDMYPWTYHVETVCLMSRVEK